MGYPWHDGATLTAADLNAAIAGASIWQVGVVTAIGTNLTLAGGVLSATTGAVTSVAGRTGAVTLTHSDLTDWTSATSSFLTSTTAASTYAPLASPTFTGTVTIPGGASISGYLTTATAASTYAPLASPTFTGSPTVPGYLTTATAASTYAPLASPTFSGTVTAATTNVGAFTATGITSSPISGSTGSFTTLAASSTVSGAGFSAYLASPPAIGGTVAAAGSFTTLSASSTVSGAGFTTLLTPYALLASPTFTGTVTAATTNVGAFTATGITASPISGSTGSFTTLSASSTVSGAGITTLLTPYALLASPTFTGTPAAPTATAGTNTTQLATTAYVTAAVTAATAGVASFNTRTGAVTLTSGDVTTALTFTPYNATNPSGYQTAANITTTLASPPAIGGSAAAAGSFTTLSASSTVSGTGFSTYLASPPAIGGSAAAAGSFTTLSASSTVSGAGFSTYLASPPAIGGSAAAAGTFTALTVSSSAQFNTDLFVGANGSAKNLWANGPAATFRSHVFGTAGSARWNISCDSTAESGSNAGSDLQFRNYNDAGSNIGTPLKIVRSTGVVQLATGVAISGTSTIDSATIGGTTPAAGSFTTLSATSTVSGAGFTARFASPGPIGNTSASTGAFTTLSASSTVSGAGFTAAIVGGGAVSTPSSNQTLTSASSRAQSFAPTVAALTVTLPDATTLSAGGPIFSLYNAGGYTFGVRRNGGTLLTVVPPGATADCYLDDNGTAAGTWHATGQGLQSAFETASTTLTGALIAAATTLLGCIGSVAIYWQGGSTGLQAFDTAGGTVGSVATLTSTATSPILLTVDSTHGLIVYYGSNNICAQVLTLSGTSITVQTQATIATGTPNGLAAAVILTTGSSYLVAYNVSTGSYAVQIGVSGTTATFGSAVSSGVAVNWTATSPLSVISSTQVLGVLATTANAVRVVGVSGTTVTMNTAAAATTAPSSVLALSTTLFVLSEGSTGLQAVSVSGTTCTVGTQSGSFGAGSATALLFAASSTSFFIVTNAASPNVLYYGTISGTTMTMAASVTMANDWAVGGSSAATTLVNNPLAAVSTGYLYVPSEGVLTASGSAFSVVQPDLWPDQMMVSGSDVLQDGAGGLIIPVAAGNGFRSLATAQTSGNLLIKPGRIYPVGNYTAALSGAISAGKFVVGTSSPGRTAPTGTGAQWRVATWELAT